MAIYSWFPHRKWWFSIAMLVYQRGINSKHPKVDALRALPGTWWWGPLRASWLKQPVPQVWWSKGQGSTGDMKLVVLRLMLSFFASSFSYYPTKIPAPIRKQKTFINLHMSSYVLMLESDWNSTLNASILVLVSYFGGWISSSRPPIHWTRSVGGRLRPGKTMDPSSMLKPGRGEMSTF